MKLSWSSSAERLKLEWAGQWESERRTMDSKESQMRNTKRALVVIAAIFAVSSTFFIQTRAHPSAESAAHLRGERSCSGATR
jgi:hypothetical protein